jgi:hypothetical protein
MRKKHWLSSIVLGVFGFFFFFNLTPFGVCMNISLYTCRSRILMVDGVMKKNESVTSYGRMLVCCGNVAESISHSDLIQS